MNNIDKLKSWCSSAEKAIMDRPVKVVFGIHDTKWISDDVVMVYSDCIEGAMMISDAAVLKELFAKTK